MPNCGTSTPFRHCIGGRGWSGKAFELASTGNSLYHRLGLLALRVAELVCATLTLTKTRQGMEANCFTWIASPA